MKSRKEGERRNRNIAILGATFNSWSESLSQDALDTSPFFGSNLSQGHVLEHVLELLGMSDNLLEISEQLWIPADYTFTLD